jgi:hypothetical protein
VVQRECADVLAAGPGPLQPDELELARYSLTDQLDDLAGGASAHVRDAIAIEVWRRTAELLLATSCWWEGNGKWIVREVEACDRAHGTVFAERLHIGLRDACRGRRRPGPPSACPRILPASPARPAAKRPNRLKF